MFIFTYMHMHIYLEESSQNIDCERLIAPARIWE